VPYTACASVSLRSNSNAVFQCAFHVVWCRNVHKLVKAIKGCTSRVLREEFPSLRSRLPTLWTNSYFVATTGGAPLATVQRYVEQQKGR
jgi:putative transposase